MRYIHIYDRRVQFKRNLVAISDSSVNQMEISFISLCILIVFSCIQINVIYSINMLCKHSNIINYLSKSSCVLHGTFSPLNSSWCTSWPTISGCKFWVEKCNLHARKYSIFLIFHQPILLLTWKKLKVSTTARRTE